MTAQDFFKWAGFCWVLAIAAKWFIAERRIARLARKKRDADWAAGMDRIRARQAAAQESYEQQRRMAQEAYEAHFRKFYESAQSRASQQSYGNYQAPFGFQSLPDWAGVLGFTSMPTLDDAERSFRRLAKSAHPDHGGSHEAMTRLNQAVTAARKALSN